MSKEIKKTPWGKVEKENWYLKQTIKRSYRDEVVTKIEKLKTVFDVSQIGALSLDPAKYPVFLIRSKNIDPSKKTVVITGGVHGYETSGVHGALAFMEREAQNYPQFNFICAPCVSPWAYETINRWNNLAIDPNRNFKPHSEAEECVIFLNAMKGVDVFAHFDLHETTDTDNSIFRPAKAERDGTEPDEWSEIPDGFYVVGDTKNPQPEFQKAVIEKVKKVTHIAPPDGKGNIIGEPIISEGVILYDMKALHLCGGFSDAKFSTTTEVYPDSPKVTPENCIDAQVASIVGGLDYVRLI